MSTAPRIFNIKQALEREVKELYVRGSFEPSEAATAVTSGLNAEITYTSVASGLGRNDATITIEVEAAAANPTNTVLAVFTGTSAAVTITITPNDGTNNSATAVGLTTAELVELINEGSVTGKSVTVTDASSLRELQTASGGDNTALADSGEGDGVEAAFAGGDLGTVCSSKYGVASISRVDAGEFELTLEDVYYDFKAFKGLILKSSGVDLRFQIKSVDLASKKIVFFLLSGSTATDPDEGLEFFIRMDLKNTTLAY